MLKKLMPRKKLFVSGRIQGQFIFRIGTYWVLYHVVLWHAMFAFYYVQQRLNGVASSMDFREMYGSYVLQYYPLILCSLVMLPVFLIDLLKLSHKIAGPLVRFSHSLRSMMAGENVNAVKLRDGDLLTEFETLFNEYIEVYNQRREAQIPTAQMTDEEADRVTEIAPLADSAQLEGAAAN
ncbi:MAG: hypothetical protein ACK5Q5_23010 [Planctomycetaceae bacterium]